MRTLAEASLKYRTSLLVLTVVFVWGGLLAYQKMGRLEDPEFTIKQAQVITAYPGATAREVELHVTEVIEKTVQQLGQVDYIKSTSMPGLSTVDVHVKDQFGKETLPQVWDELRRKVTDAQRQLPPEAAAPVVYDDFGDVYGVFFAITGDGYSMNDLKDVAKFLQRELLTVHDVAKINLVGVLNEAVYIELDPRRMAQFGVSRDQIYQAVQSRNIVVDAGEADIGGRRVMLRPSGEFTTAEQMGELLIAGSAGDPTQPMVYLDDLAMVRRDYVDPPGFLLRVDGKPAVGIAISTVKGGNVVTMGEAIKARMEQIHAQGLIPFGITYHPISIQSEAVTAAISGFVESLIQAVVIVIVVLLLFMGLRSGLIIGAVLLITIIGSFIFMYGMGIMLERISLGALIIALGMLVDNAIVITEGMLVRIQRGEDKTRAAGDVVSQNSIPLLGATLVAILAFAAIGASNDSSGEYTRSLFQVIMISLLFSWLTAVTVTPLLCAMFLKPKPAGSAEAYSGSLFGGYRRLLLWSLRHRFAVLAGLFVLLGLSIVAFSRVETAFFPSSTRPQLMVDFWLREGTSLETTRERALEAEALLADLEPVTSVTTFIGQGPPRYLLTLSPEGPNSSYVHFLISVEDYREIDGLMREVQHRLTAAFPEAISQAYKFALGPGIANKIQLRLSGPDGEILRGMADQVMQVMHEDGSLIGIQTDWRGKVIEYRPVLRDTQARQLGIDRPMVAHLLKETYGGRQVGLFQDGDEMLPILVRAPERERGRLELIESLAVRSPAAGSAVPLGQVVSAFEVVQADSIIKRRDRTPTLTVKCNPREGNASVALARLMPKIDALALPAGYRLVYGGEYEDSNKANASLQNKVLFCGLLMILIVILLFNSLRQPLIIWLCVPLSIIGVAFGLLASGQPFGFMALLGLLSLSGMLIKNAIVLIDEINLQRLGDKPLGDAIVDSGISRMRPVMMAAATTVLGMVPLLFDAFFVAMAVTIMAGLTFATILTLVIVPVLYSVFFGGRRKA